MCGIIGYVGRRSACPILMDGLRRLEYRGYDSAGIAVISNSGIEMVKTKGKLQVLTEILENKSLKASVGIGHTRWATHGVPSNENAHPHNNEKNQFSLVHNGIIENYLCLKKSLMEKGHIFKSDTDTEVLVHLLEEYFEGDLTRAVIRMLHDVEGSYAIGVISSLDPQKIVAARQDSPLVVGTGRNENFLASDIPAFLQFTRNVIHVKDREVVSLAQDGVEIFDLEGHRIQREPSRIHWDASIAEKNGFKHFMLKEIFEQPRVISDVLSGRMTREAVNIEELKLTDDDFRSINKIIITACGTAFHAGMVGKYFLEELARISVEIDIASELRYRNPLVDEKTLILAISQSGETADTLASFRDAISRGAKSLAVTNVVGSSITRETENLIFTRAGLEIGVAATKTFTAQVIALFLLAIKMGMARESIDIQTYLDYRENLMQLPRQVEKILDRYNEIRNVARKYYKCRDFLFLGRNISYPIALEGALKLKEISYIHAEGYAAGEMKHGPIALIDEMTPVVSILPKGPVYDKILSNIKEVKARGAVTVGVVFEGDENTGEYLDEVLYIPETRFYLSSVLANIPLQLLAYFIADRKNRDVDQPRNLAKSVTVE